MIVVFMLWINVSSLQAAGISSKQASSQQVYHYTDSSISQTGLAQHENVTRTHMQAKR